MEGAVARSDLTLKLQMVESALAKCEVELGEKCEKPEPTKGYLNALSNSATDLLTLERTTLMKQKSDSIESDEQLKARLTSERNALASAREAKHAMFAFLPVGCLA